MTFSVADSQFMARAIQIAKRGRYTTAPNPNVGCVVVKQGQLLLESYHQRAGEGHAEARVIQQAIQQNLSLKGATCYVTLEPCSHQGRTPSCAKALIEQQVSRVVVAMLDPNPLVAGKGIALLEAAGITVDVGLMSESARALNPGFLSRIEKQRPYIRLKLAASLDARTALSNGESKWISGPQSRSDVQRERAQSHGILSTAQTVIRDNARLNVRYQQLGSLAERYPESQLRQPVKVIIDRQQRLAEQSQHLAMFQEPSRIIVLSYQHQALPEWVDQVIIPAQEQWLALAMQQLAQLELNDLWVEAGAGLAAGLLEAQLVDQLIIYTAGKLMGQDAQALIGLQGYNSMSDLDSWVCQDHRIIGSDIKTIWQQA